MKRSSTIFLQAAIVLVAIAAFVFLLWEPQIEGRNVHATQFQIYFNDPFLAWAYSASVFFFVALHQAFQLLGRSRRDEVFSENSLRALRTIKYCGMVLLGFVAAGEAYLFIAVRGEDDIAGGVAMGILVALVASTIALAAFAFERNLQSRVSQRPH